MGWIVGVLIRQGLRHNHTAGGIDRQMQLAPFPARLRAIEVGRVKRHCR